MLRLSSSFLQLNIQHQHHKAHAHKLANIEIRGSIIYHDFWYKPIKAFNIWIISNQFNKDLIMSKRIKYNLLSSLSPFSQIWRKFSDFFKKGNNICLWTHYLHQIDAHFIYKFYPYRSCFSRMNWNWFLTNDSFQHCSFLSDELVLIYILTKCLN